MRGVIRLVADMVLPEPALPDCRLPLVVPEAGLKPGLQSEVALSSPRHGRARRARHHGQDRGHNGRRKGRARGLNSNGKGRVPRTRPFAQDGLKRPSRGLPAAQLRAAGHEGEGNRVTAHGIAAAAVAHACGAGNMGESVGAAKAGFLDEIGHGNVPPGGRIVVFLRSNS